jgi:hypothetical protein
MVVVRIYIEFTGGNPCIKSKHAKSKLLQKSKKKYVDRLKYNPILNLAHERFTL